MKIPKRVERTPGTTAKKKEKGRKKLGKYILTLEAENKKFRESIQDLQRRLLSHKRGEAVEAECDQHGKWW